ncbi:MAG: peptide-methionine (S)-S-oxide reductase MsrA [Parabacteroides sp.]|nr:peptide-methionine (S)-S-oxide reductase MsrA [Parabacteroides sp.]
MKDKAEIYLAGGCFWGTEHFLKQIRGVEHTEVGYANSQVPHPTYEEVCTGDTGAAETVKVVYDPQTVGLDLLLNLYFQTIDPTSVNRQGEDSGLQYRTGIYYTDKEDVPVIEAAVKELAKEYTEPIVVEVVPLVNFYAAEEYHQDYLDKHVDGYCHIHPGLFELARKANFLIQDHKRGNKDECES